MFYVPSTKDVRRMLFLIICREIKCAQVFHVNNKKLNKRWCWLIIIIDRASQWASFCGWQTLEKLLLLLLFVI
jgi:hypothetical protein